VRGGLSSLEEDEGVSVRNDTNIEEFKKEIHLDIYSL